MMMGMARHEHSNSSAAFKNRLSDRPYLRHRKRRTRMCSCMRFDTRNRWVWSAWSIASSGEKLPCIRPSFLSLDVLRSRPRPAVHAPGPQPRKADNMTPTSRLLGTVIVATGLAFGALSAHAEDAMKKDSMKSDAMKNDGAAKKDAMHSDSMKKDSMQSDAMKKDGMKSEKK